MFQGNKAGAVNDHTAIVKKPQGLKASYNNSSNVPRDHRESVGAGALERDSRDHRERERERDRPGPRDINSGGQKFGHSAGQLKRSPSFSANATTGNNSHHTPHGPPPPKKHKLGTSLRDTITVSEAAKYGSLNDYAFFDKVT